MKNSFLIIFFLVVITFNAHAEEIFRLVVLDVGEGQAVLLQKDASGILIDTGHFGRIHDVIKSIKRYGVADLDAIFLTHLHPDHASGIFRVMESFPRAEIYETGHRIPFSPHLDAYRWVAEALDVGMWKVKKISQGERIDWRGVTLDILWPKKASGGALNSQSLVMAVEYKGANFLIMGDAGVNEEAQLLIEQRLPHRVDVLVIGHHGAADATSNGLLERVKPIHAVISINKENKRGYPDKEIVARIKRNGARIHLTGEQGDFVWSNQVAHKKTK